MLLFLCHKYMGKWASQIALVVKSLPANVGDIRDKTWAWSLGREDPLEEGMATHPGFLPGESQGQRRLAGCSPESKRIEQNQSDLACTHMVKWSRSLRHLSSLCFLPEGPNCLSLLVLFCAPDTDLTVMDSQWWNTGYGPDSRHRPGSQKVKGTASEGGSSAVGRKLVGESQECSQWSEHDWAIRKKSVELRAPLLEEFSWLHYSIQAFNWTLQLNKDDT